MAPDATKAGVTVQFYFNAPDNTLQPADSNTDRDMLIRLNYELTGISSNWQTFVCSFKDASVNAGTAADFQANYKAVDEIQYQLQINSATSDCHLGH